MTITVTNQRTYQYNPPVSHIVTDDAETINLLAKKCGYVKPWTMEGNTETADKPKQAVPQKEFRKIDFLL